MPSLLSIIQGPMALLVVQNLLQYWAILTSKRKQHFVPRFYLRHFSNDPDQKSIGVWNIQKGVFARQASLQNQAHAAYFYGKDGEVEDALAWLEGPASLAQKEVIDTEQLPRHGSIEWLVLFAHTVYQAQRTQYAAEALNESFDKFFHATFEEDERLREYLPQVHVGISNATTLGLGVVSGSTCPHGLGNEAFDEQDWSGVCDVG